MKHNYRDPKSGRFEKKTQTLTPNMFKGGGVETPKARHTYRDPVSGRFARSFNSELKGLDISFEKDPWEFFREHALYDTENKKEWRSMRRGETLRCEVMSNIIECYQRYPRVNANAPFKRYLISIFNIDLERPEILICPPSLAGQIKDEVLVQVKAIEHETALKEKWMKHAESLLKKQFKSTFKSDLSVKLVAEDTPFVAKLCIEKGDDPFDARYGRPTTRVFPLKYMPLNFFSNENYQGVTY